MAIAETVKRDKELDSEIQQGTHGDHPPTSSGSKGIKLKCAVMLASKSDRIVSTTIDAPCHALVCREVIFSLQDVAPTLPPVVTNLLQEFEDVFPAEIHRGYNL